MKKLLLLMLPFCSAAQTDTAAVKKKQLPDRGHQVRIGIDVFQPVYNAIGFRRLGYEFYGDYYHRNELYFVGEAGFGTSTYEYPDLTYNTVNTFLRLGVDKSMLQAQSGKDWDMLFIGARYGVAAIRRGEASYTIRDTLFGQTSGTIAAENLSAHWFEATAGVRVELAPRLYAGWNARTKFLLNGKSLHLPPYFIAGYGKGDRNFVFGFNFYFCYALRYGKNEVVQEK